jgi:GNAT superfamily N-acetyltransferase
LIPDPAALRPAMPRTVTLRPMTDADRPAVTALTWTADQNAYVDPWDAVLPPACPECETFVIDSAADGVVGSFQVEAGGAGGSQVCAMPGYPELRHVVIDTAHQGKGYGKALADGLEDLIRKHYPSALGLCLTVNCRNDVAHAVYKKLGFTDTGDLYHGGRSGPQHIMRWTFADTPANAYSIGSPR